MAVNKIGTYAIEHLDKDQQDILVTNYKGVSSPESKTAIIKGLCEFPFYKFDEPGTRLVKSIADHIKSASEEVLNKPVKLYIMDKETSAPTQVPGVNDIKLNWDGVSTDNLPIEFLKNLYGGDTYTYGLTIFEGAAKKGLAVNDVVVNLFVSKSDISIQLQYKLCNLSNLLETAKNDTKSTASIKGQKQSEVEAAKVDNVVNDYVQGSVDATSTKTIIISTSDEGAQKIITGISSGDVIDRSSDGSGESEKRGNFTITYY